MASTNSGNDNDARPRAKQPGAGTGSWRQWYTHGASSAKPPELRNAALLTLEEEQRYARQYTEARTHVQELLQEHPSVIVLKLKQLQESPERLNMRNYIAFTRPPTKTDLVAMNDDEVLDDDVCLDDIGKEILTSVLKNSNAVIRECMSGVENGKPLPNMPGNPVRKIAAIVAPYLRSTGKIRFQQRFLSECIEIFLTGAWEEKGLSEAKKQSVLEEMRLTREKEREAMNALVEGNLRLVVSVAKRFGSTYLPFPDMIQEGNIGLMGAIENFDWQRGIRLSTFATYRIRQAITHAINTTGRTIRIPASLLRQLNQMRTLEQSYIQEHDAEPTVEQLAELMESTPARIRALKRITQQPISLQAISSEDRDWNDFVVDKSTPSAAPVTDVHIDPTLQESLNAALESLTEKERDIVKRRFGLQGQAQQSLETVARIYNLSSERIRQLESAALLKMRRQYGKQLRPEEKE